MELTRQNVVDWIKELRSGNWKQTRGTLKRANTDDPEEAKSFSYCCIGVLGEVCQHPDLYPVGRVDSEGGNPNVYDLLNNSVGSDVTDRFVIYNDRSKYPFSKIADKVEKYILPKFPEE